VRILHTEADRYDGDLLDRLAGDHLLDAVDVTDGYELAQLLRSRDYDVLFLRLGLSVGADLLAAAPRLRWIVTPTTGVEHVAGGSWDDRVTVLSLRGSPVLERVNATAEHTFGLMLALRRRILEASADVLDGAWNRAPFMGEDLAGACLGVVGFGRLGRKVAALGRAFGMTVLVNDVDERALALVGPDARPVGLDELVGAADVVSLHASLGENTVNLLDGRLIRAMKAGAVLVNTARGELVDESALLAALVDRHLGGAALDVLAGDSGWPAGGCGMRPLLAYAGEHSNLIITPHVGGYSRQAIAITRRWIVEEFLRQTAGGTDAVGEEEPDA
jgi:D-3-phosphoglycerate dehydrogenase